ncbi:MAG TPA: TauD/TfdA family dioxygenase [Acidimicrobiales bacterium]|nr:TauD/TfdA family dioxygenase [Acidimicrobiales bacterium]
MGDVLIRPCNNVIGAEVDGVDLADLSDDQFAAIDQALLDHQVLFFHDQPLTDEEHLAFAARFGEPSIFPVSKLLGGDTRLQYIEDTADSPPDADDWHTDVTWIAEPPQIAVLSARTIPEVGGDTMWSSLTAAYEALSPAMQQICAGLTVRHHRGRDFDDRVGRFLDAEQMQRLEEGYPAVEHPLLRTHPRTGRTALFLSGLFMQEVVGMTRAESDALLGFLLRHGQDPNFQVRWRWRADDLAVWDERVTNHRALSDHYPQHRVMRRVTVDGERPVYTPVRVPA